MIFEVCVNSAISAIEAQLGGADRVELCENMADGGCTPSYGTLIFARKKLQIPIFVMIRPRGADFCYSPDEFEIMKHDIVTAKNVGANGVVFGILKTDGSIDKERMTILADLSRPLGITCHRAFDMTRDPDEALESLISIGIDRVLTSGQSDSAYEGASLIRRLISKCGDKIVIMPGHGIKEPNFLQVIEATKASEFHLYLTKQLPTTMKFIRKDVKMGKPELSEYEVTLTDRESVRRAKEIITNYELRITN